MYNHADRKDFVSAGRIYKRNVTNARTKKYKWVRRYNTILVVIYFTVEFVHQIRCLMLIIF